MFIRYTGASLLQVPFLSQDWELRIELLRKLYESEALKSAEDTLLKQ